MHYIYNGENSHYLVKENLRLSIGKENLFTTWKQPKNKQVADTTWKQPKNRQVADNTWKKKKNEKKPQSSLLFLKIPAAKHPRRCSPHGLVSELVLGAEPATQGCIGTIYHMKMHSAKWPLICLIGTWKWTPQNNQEVVYNMRTHTHRRSKDTCYMRIHFPQQSSCLEHENTRPKQSKDTWYMRIHYPKQSRSALLYQNSR